MDYEDFIEFVYPEVNENIIKNKVINKIIYTKLYILNQW